MKIFTYVIGLLLIAFCAHASTNSSIVKIDGTWSGVYDSKGEDGQPPKNFIFKFKSDGDLVTGIACDTTTNPDVWIELKKIELKDNKIYFTSEPMPGMDIKCEGEVEGDKMDLSFSYTITGMQGVVTNSFTLEREK